jgi:hypothetical protein
MCAVSVNRSRLTAVAEDAVAGPSGCVAVCVGAGCCLAAWACTAPAAHAASTAAQRIAERHRTNILLDCSDVPIALISQGQEWVMATLQ